MSLVLDGIYSLWFLLVALSLIFIVIDVMKLPVSWVQKLGWILVVLYTGPFGLFFYLLACRNPGKNLHELYTSAHWKQSINSEVHCLAGDASGIILSAIILSFVSIANGVELLIEYLSAFMFGWLIFQAGMMVTMYKNYGEAVKKTFFAETVSMNMVMLGMIPTMVILMHYIKFGDNPSHLAFWFIMGIATIIGGITAYPINSWLVKNKLKHGCMTLPSSQEKKSAYQREHSQHMPTDKNASPTSAYEQPMHEMQKLPVSTAFWIVLGSFVLLAIVIMITTFFVPIHF